MTHKNHSVHPMRGTFAHGSKAEKGSRNRAVMPVPEELAPGVPATPAHDLMYHGGNLLPNLEFFNFYVGGSDAWPAAAITAIDHDLEAAMTDANLNHVMSQYFHGGKTSVTFKGSKVLAGPPPAVVSQGDVEALVKRLYRGGGLKGFHLTQTVFNFMLPSGTILNTDTAPTSSTINPHAEAAAPATVIPHDEEDSTQGLGGYHGSIHIGKVKLYYAIGVFSENLPNGVTNGIVVFDQPAKNVVATFYHELNEARTDPDVEDAIRAGNSPNAGKFLGWTSQQGEECGDFPVFEANPLTKVFKEVALSSGTGTVAVQFQYSNAVHGPEGPIPNPDPPLLA